MKAITVKAPLAWAIFNANYTDMSYYEPIDCPTQLAIHAVKSAYSFDVEKFFKDTGIVTPPANRLPLGQVVGVVTVESCADKLSRWDWIITNPKSIKRFDYKGQTGIYEIPDERINYDCSKNPIIEECGYKSKGNPRGQWWVTVWPHPYTKNHYSYSAAIAGGVMGSSGIPGHSLLHGCYADPEEALQAGIEELYQP
ncbi:hypothetical protein [Nostoc sp. JL23]|uniref:hypothetical protein n=1 Tax=Nostoc sp. JL23 TaxID=2815394 RepID=UPI001DB85A8F|nr:hypothetical protein [Nostoc sp. JL23]MBN3875262.1 hypothetical protein [Nostoc sp. JL23]